MIKLLRARRDLAALLNDIAVATAANDCINKWAKIGAFKGLSTMTAEANTLFAESMLCVYLEIGSFIRSEEIDWPLLFKTATEARNRRNRLLELL